MSLRVRERPPLRHSIEVLSPNGRRHRWADDEPDPANIPGSLQHSSTMSGGFADMSCTLPRKPGVDYSDLERLTTLRVRDASGEIVSETRLERTPRVSGSQMAINPAAVGWQAHLDDDKSARIVFLDGDLTRWRTPSPARQEDIVVAGRTDVGFSVAGGASDRALIQELSGEWEGPVDPASEAWYDAGEGNTIGELLYEWERGTSVNGADTNWTWQAFLADADNDIIDLTDTSGNLRSTATDGDGSVPASEDDRRFAVLRLAYTSAAATTYGASGEEYHIRWPRLLVVGNHELPLTDEGLLASDIVTYTVGRWAPALRIAGGSVEASTFPIPQLAFFEPTTAGEILRQAARYELPDWAVWEHRTLHWFARGTRGRNWRARIAPAQLEETGPQLDRLWTSVVVPYQDEAGATRTVGPPGSGAGTESALLVDSDPQNPATLIGIDRCEQLPSIGVNTASGAIQVGRRFLEEQKLLDSSGRAQLVGHVEDDRGVLHPYSHVRAGDTVTFVDASDPSPRRVVKASHTHDTRTCTVDLDAPPEGLAALLERLGART